MVKRRSTAERLAAASGLLLCALGGARAQTVPVPSPQQCRNRINRLNLDRLVDDLVPCLDNGAGGPGSACCAAIDGIAGPSTNLYGCLCNEGAAAQLDAAFDPLLDRLGGLGQAVSIPRILSNCRLPQYNGLFGCPFVPFTPPFQPTPVPPVFTPPPPPPPPVCVDDPNANCTTRVAAGECIRNPPAMCTSCCLGCREIGECVGFVPPPPPPPAPAPGVQCVDNPQFVLECPLWAGLGECERNPTWMLPNCPLSCGTCEPACVDTDPACVGWAALGLCPQNPDFLCDFCCASCSGDPECQARVPPPPPPFLPPPPPSGPSPQEPLREKARVYREYARAASTLATFLGQVQTAGNQFNTGITSVEAGIDSIKRVIERRDARNPRNTPLRKVWPPGIDVGAAPGIGNP